MHKEIKERYVSLLRSLGDETAQLVGAELVVTEDYTYMDAYAILASLFMAENDCLIGFVPVHGRDRGRDVGISEFYFYPRQELLQWSGLTGEELTALIGWNDDAEMDFFEIASVIESGWK